MPPVAGQGQQHRAAIGGGNAASDVHPCRQAVGAEGDGTGETEGAGLQIEAGQLQAAIWQPGTFGQEPDIRPEEIAVIGGEQRGDVAGQPGGKAVCRLALGGAGGQLERTGQARRAVGRQRDAGGKLVDQPIACDLERQRRLSRQAKKPGGNTARSFLQSEVQRQLTAGIGVAALQAQRPHRAVDALNGQRGRPFAIGQLHRPLQRDFRRCAQDRRAEFDAGGRKRADGDRHRQVRQAKAAGLGGEAGASAGGGRADQVNRFGLQAGDLDPALQQGGAVPVEADPLQGQPDALIVGDGHPGQAGPRRQGPPKALDIDDAAGTGQIVLDEAGQIVLVGLLRAGEGGPKHQQQGQQHSHQKACPMPR